MAIDLDFAEAVINRPHIIDLRADGWTIMHPPACHPNLFDCSVNQAAGEQIDGPLDFQGRFYCGLDDFGLFYVGDSADDAVGIDWTALVAELRVTRAVAEAADRVVNGRAVQSELRAALTAWHEHHGELR